MGEHTRAELKANTFSQNSTRDRPFCTNRIKIKNKMTTIIKMIEVFFKVSASMCVICECHCLEEQRSHAADFTLFLNKYLKVLIDDGNGQ